jgi:hypothetical protein
MRTAIAELVRDRNVAAGHQWFADLDEHRLLDMQQYNLFPNLTVLVFSDMLQVVRSRPGATPDDAFIDAFAFVRDPSSPRVKPAVIEVAEDDDLPLGLVLDQDFKNFARAQRGMHQPGMTHLTLSPTEECRILNLHKNLEEYLDL